MQSDPCHPAAWVIAAAVAATGTLSPEAGADTATTASSFAATRPVFGTNEEFIHETLLKTGTLDTLAVRLAAADATDPAVLAATARVATERGDPATALRALSALAVRAPGDPHVLADLARIQEQRAMNPEAEKTLRAAIAASTDPEAGLTLRLRLAVLIFDGGRAADGVALLDEAVRLVPAAATRVGVIAFLEGQFSAAEGYLKSARGERLAALTLLEGVSALRAGHNAAAGSAFANALGRVTEDADKRYAGERLIAAARQSGTLGKLADDWLARPDLPGDRALALATVLRELGRVPELLTWWHRTAAEPGRTPLGLSPRFVTELLGACQEAGLASDAETIARQMVARDPDDARALGVLLQILLNHNKVADADALLNERISAAVMPEELERLGRLARSQGRDAEAIHAAQALRVLGGGNAVRGLLLESAIRLNAGDKALATTLLHEAAAAAATRPTALRDVATAMEGAGLESDAIDLLRRSVDQTPDDAVRERLAALLVRQRRYAEAGSVLQTLRQTGASVAVRDQATQRVLDIAFAEHKVDDLIARTQALLDAGSASEGDLSLLVDACVRSKKPEQAVRALAGSRLLDEKTRLNRLAVMHQRTGNLEAAASTLSQLVTVDPDNAVATLERLAALELDRKDSKAAAAAVDDIARRIGAGSPSFAELMGGIYDRLKRPEQAAMFYRRAVTASPNNADLWLLWSTAMSKSGAAPLAVGRLQTLCETTTDENVFAASVDGLLNLKSPAGVLRVVRRDAILRAAATPQKMILFHVLRDIADELKEPDTIVRALDAGIALDREERPQLLRELMEMAAARGRSEEATACGRSILALGDDFPPELFLQLGGRLLIEGRPQEASRAFARAAEVASDDVVLPRAAGLFEQYGYPAAALSAISPLSDRNPSDLDLHHDVARLSEVVGTPDAFDHYLAAVRLAVGQVVAADADILPGSRLTGAPLPDLAGLITSAAATARSPVQQGALITTLDRLLRDVIETAPDGVGPPSSINALSSGLRHACIVLGRPDTMDRTDEAIARRWPTNQLLKTRALTARIDEGLYDAARAFAEKHRLLNQLPPAWRLTQSGSTTLPADATPEQAAAVLPRLLMGGDRSAARRVLAAVPLAMPARPAATLPTLIAAAMTLGDDATATRWTLFWARHATPNRPASGPSSAKTPSTSMPSAAVTANDLRTVVQSVWWVLSPDARTALLDEIVKLTQDTRLGQDPTAGGWLVLQLAAANGADLPGRLDIALQLVTRSQSAGGLSSGQVAMLASLIQLLPPGDGPAFVQRATAVLPATVRLAFLQRLVSESIEPFDAATDAAISTAAGTISGEQRQDVAEWFTSTAHDGVLLALSDATERTLPPSGVSRAAPAIAAAVGRSRITPGAGDALALDALDSIRTAGFSPGAPSVSPGPGQATTKPAAPAPRGGAALPRTLLIRYAVAALSDDARSRLLSTLDAGVGTGLVAGATDAALAGQAWRHFARSAVLDALGRRDDGLAALRQAYAVAPDEGPIRQVYVDRLMSDGRATEMVKAFVADANRLPPPVLEPLTLALQSLFRFREVFLPEKGLGASAINPRRAVDFMTPRATSDAVRLAQCLREILERVRSDHGALGPVIEADPGGLPPVEHRSEKTFADIADWPNSIDDLIATIRVIPARARGAGRLAGILGQAAINPSVAGPIVAGLHSRAGSGQFTNADLTIARALAVVPGVILSAEVRDRLLNATVNDTSGDPDYAGLALCLKAQNDARAADVRSWALERAKVGDPTYSNSAAHNSATPPPPISGQNDLASAAWVEAVESTEGVDAAESLLRHLRKTGRVSGRQPECGLIWTRLAAERGDVAVFSARLRDVAERLAWSQLDTPARIDLSGCLPRGPLTPAVRDELASATERVFVQAAHRWPGNANWARALASLGRWCNEQAAGASAKRVLAAAATAADAAGMGEHQLWVADLAGELGLPDMSEAIERRLLEERCLPAARMTPLLRQLLHHKEEATAFRLAQDAVGYCQEPTLRAIAHGDRREPSTEPLSK